MFTKQPGCFGDLNRNTMFLINSEAVTIFNDAIVNVAL